MTTERTTRRLEPTRFTEAPPVLSAEDGVASGKSTTWPILVLPADRGVADAATPGSGVATAVLEHETAFLERRKRQLDLSPHLASDVPEARVAGIVSWSDLTDEVLLTILANTGLMKGLRLDPERLVLEPAARAAFTVDAESVRESVNLCREDYFTHRACEGEVETALATSSVVKGSASVSYAFASGKVEASRREQSSGREGHRSVTAVGRQLSRRAVVHLGPDRLRPTPAFLEGVLGALARPDVVAQAEALSEVFDAFGLIWAQEVSLGSARTVSTDVQVSDTATSSEIERHISAAVNAKFGGVSGRATGEAGQDTSAEAHVRDEVAQASSTTQGDVESPLHWAVIARARLTPVYEVLPQEIRDRVLEVLFRTRPELVAPLFAGPRVPETEVSSRRADATRATAGGPSGLIIAELRRHTPVTNDTLLMVTCEGTVPEGGWSHIDVEASADPRGPVASARLAMTDADVDASTPNRPALGTAVDAILEARGMDPAGIVGAPDPPSLLAVHSVLVPVRWPDAYVLRQRMGITGEGESFARLAIEVMPFRDGDRSHFDAWTEWLPWDPTRDLTEVCPAGALVHRPTGDRHETATQCISWSPERSGLLVMTSSAPNLDTGPQADPTSVDVRVEQGRLIGSFAVDPRLPTPLSLTLPIVKTEPLTLRIVVRHYLRDADPLPIRRASIPLRFWFLPIRDAVAHMGVPEPIVVNDLYTAHSDGFVTLHQPSEMFGALSVMVQEAGPDHGPNAVVERRRALGTCIRGATVTAPVRQGEAFRAVVTAGPDGRVDNRDRLADYRRAAVEDDPAGPRAVFVPLRLVIPS